MADNSAVIESLMTSAYIPAINEHRDHDALAVAILIYLMSQGAESRTGAVGLIQTAASIVLEKEQGVITQSCSFCGEKPPKVKLGLGGTGDRTAYICNSCVDMLHAAFHKKDRLLNKAGRIAGTTSVGESVSRWLFLCTRLTKIL